MHIVLKWRMVIGPVRGTNITRNLGVRRTEVRALIISRKNANCDVLEVQVISAQEKCNCIFRIFPTLFC